MRVFNCCKNNTCTCIYNKIHVQCVTNFVERLRPEMCKYNRKEKIFLFSQTGLIPISHKVNCDWREKHRAIIENINRVNRFSFRIENMMAFDWKINE